MILKIALEKVLSECVPTSKYKEIRDVIGKCLQDLASNPISNEELKNEKMMFYWVPFKLILTTASSTPKMKESCLDMIHKLIAFRIFHGTSQPFEKDAFPIPSTPMSDSKPKTEEASGQSVTYFMDDVILTLANIITNPTTNVDNEVLQLQLIKVILTIVSGPFQIHGASLIYCFQCVFRIYVYAGHHRVNQLTAKASLNQMVNSVFSRLNAKGTVQPNAGPLSIEPIDPDLEFNLRDAQALLKYLCLVTMKPEMENDPNSTISILGRSLAYELLLSAFEQSGGHMRNNQSFINLIKQDLILSLSKIGTSVHPGLFELSLSVFLIVLDHFHEFLKPEVEVLFNEIYMRILESPNATYQQKSMVLNGLLKLSNNSEYLMDFYVNYDCDIGMEAIYERIMFNFCKILSNEESSLIQFQLPENVNPSPLIFKLRLKALKCVIASLESFLKFYSTKHELTSSNISRKSSEESIDDTKDIKEVQEKKKQFLEGLAIFNKKPSHGINFLIEKGFIQNESGSIADFFLTNPSLNKKSIGEYLGEGDAKMIAVMHSFIDKLDFSHQDFVSCLRGFLQRFRLPGESQKIDRIMEKFADRYYELNPSLFANADTAYTLAYSIIMLNTDQHSKQIKNRMTKEQFIKNNRGINNNADLPDQFLAGIFDDISTNEIIMKDEILEKKKLDEDTDDIYITEIAEMKDKSEARLKGRRPVAKPFRKVRNLDIVRMMLKHTEKQILESLRFSFLYEEMTPEITLEAFLYFSRLTFLLEVETNIIKILYDLTRSPKTNGITPRIIEALKSFIYLANINSLYLNEEEWYLVLSNISYMESLNMLSNESEKESSITSFSSLFTKMKKKPANEAKSAILKEFTQQSHIVAIDRIFTQTINLPGPNISYFFKALCRVSIEEFEKLRMFSLQKIVEITYYNMNRIRLEWTQIWKILQPHFNLLGTDKNKNIATFALDSLRQLSMKLLERQELAHFHTQNDFLKSFEYIMKQQAEPSIRELCISSLSQIILHKGASLKSGWKSVFVVFGKAAHDKEEKILQMAFDFIETVISKNCNPYYNQSYVDYIQCLIEFCIFPKNENLVLKALELIEFESASTSKLKSFQEKIDSTEAHRESIVRDPSSNDCQLFTFSEDSFYLSWFPVISGLCRVIIEQLNPTVRTKAFDILIGIFNRIADNLEAEYWRTVYRSVFIPMFEDTTHDHSSWLLTLRLLIHVFKISGDKLQEFYKGFYHQILLVILNKQNDSFVQSSFLCFYQFCVSCSSSILWDDWVVFLERVCKYTLPYDLIQFGNDKRIEAENDKNDDQKTIEASKESDTIKPAEPKSEPREVVSSNVEISKKPSSNPSSEKVQEIQGNMAASNSTSREFPITSPINKFDPSILFPKSMFQSATHLLFLQTMEKLLFHETDTILSKIPEQGQSRLCKVFEKSFQFAYDFNQNTALRYTLWKQGFIAQLDKLYLTKQETMGLRILFELYPRLNMMDAFVQQSHDFLSRFCSLVQDVAKNQNTIDIYCPTLVSLFHLVGSRIKDEKIVKDFFPFAVKLMTLNDKNVRDVLQEYMSKMIKE